MRFVASNIGGYGFPPIIPFIPLIAAGVAAAGGVTASAISGGKAKKAAEAQAAAIQQAAEAEAAAQVQAQQIAYQQALIEAEAEKQKTKYMVFAAFGLIATGIIGYAMFSGSDADEDEE